MNPQLQREGNAGHLGQAFDALDIVFTALFTLELLLVMCAPRFPRAHRALSPAMLSARQIDPWDRPGTPTGWRPSGATGAARSTHASTSISPRAAAE